MELEKKLYCYNCKEETVYQKRRNNNTYMESHCRECGCFEWQNRAVESEVKKWAEYNLVKGIPNFEEVQRII
ncbi:hypothetical protein MKZ08_03825 [Viridibacillus sp. FSL R5-0477]|uniref:Uncharacterized protein n=1 Tax=Viridibacillus arenosi FSL R5-213 TaxID=1227360 RepID=W4EQD0_9BACL|nr:MULTISPECIES: hypothetical protein [Viridibacillus]ETT81986.1 hypothetical protein C176_17481 [Viridibacillus arenosi FSL R5-213]OMC81433.1 hypothetical protein BK130_14895 [Viridibacillus sp. FSL H8-0123]OMC86856.1 hypothetical protein BK128_09325 [Viridibacillus sp. FSL H7-0596]OMC90481.1 hypothetical protein BK137_12935 [Viridibacillus arenosi]